MNPEVEPHIQLAIDGLLGLLKAYELQAIDLKALSSTTVFEYLKDFEMARPHLDFMKYRRLTALQQALAAQLDKE